MEDAGIKEIAANCSRLQTLILLGCFRISDDALICIRYVELLLKQKADRNILTRYIYFIAIKHSTACKELTEVDLSHCPQLTDVALTALMKGCKKLAHIRIAGCYRFSARKIGELVSHYKDSLQTLDVSYIPSLSDNTLAPLLLCTKLTTALLCYGKFKTPDYGKQGNRITEPPISI